MAAVLDFGLIILRQTRLKRSAFVGPEILGLFVSTMIADEIKFSLNLWSLHKFLYIFKEKDKAHSLSISEIIDSEIHGCLNVKKSCLRTISSSQCVNRSQKLPKSARQQFYPIISSFLDKLNRKTSPLVGSKILGLFASTLTAEGNHSRHNREKFQQAIQVQLLQKSEAFFFKLHGISEIYIKF